MVPGSSGAAVTADAAALLDRRGLLSWGARGLGATALLDLYGTTLHAIRRAGPPLPDRLAVVGCGPIGLGAVSVAKALGVDASELIESVPEEN